MKTYQTHLPCPCDQCNGAKGTPTRLVIIAEDWVDRHILQAIQTTLERAAQDVGGRVSHHALDARISVERITPVTTE